MARAASRVTLGCHCIPLMTSDSDPHAARRVHGTPLDPENEPPIGVSWLPRLCGLTDQRIERIALDRCECIAPGREEMGNCRSGGLGVPWQFPHLFEFRHRQRFAREQRSAPSVRSVRSASPSALMPATWPQRANATQARGARAAMEFYCGRRSPSVYSVPASFASVPISIRAGIPNSRSYATDT